MDIDEIMGFRECPMCGTKLKEGYCGSEIVMGFLGKKELKKE